MTSRHPLRRGLCKVGFALASALILAGCAAQEQPVGIGRGTDDYKKSPCACATIDENTPPGFWEDIGNFKLG